MVKTKKSSSGKNTKKAKLSPLRRPEEMSLEQWQTALRKQYAQTQEFRIKNIGEESLFRNFW